jgi:aminoglycoside phosphotransferase (APT) family kinase protein
MSPHGLAPPTVDLATVAPRALTDAAQQAGVDAADAALIRLYATAVYHLPAADAVARIATVTSPRSLPRLTTSVAVTRWLAETGYPTVQPLPVDQPVAVHGCAVTFWRYLPQRSPPPSVAGLGILLRTLHGLPSPPCPLPNYRPLGSLLAAIESSQAITDEERTWLRSHCQHLLDAYDQLGFDLPPGMIHGDAWRGNLLWDQARVVLADWDAVSTGPREIDLIPTLQASRFGLPASERDAFIAAYGHDIRRWSGYRVLLAMRELSTMTALLRNALADPPVHRELQIRLRSIRTGDDNAWTSF